MRVATFSIAGERRVGLVDLDAGTVAPFDLPVERAREGILALIERNGAGVPRTLSPVSLSAVEIEAPIPRPRRNIFCVGKNYHEHAHEFARSGFDSSAGAGAVPKHPIIFSKVPESVVANHASVLIDSSVSTAIDYEAELAVIIGKEGRGISKENALDHVWGYTIVNDVTARDLQGRYSQWLIGKSQDTFCPMGPWAVTRDELDLGTAGIRSTELPFQRPARTNRSAWGICRAVASRSPMANSATLAAFASPAFPRAMPRALAWPPSTPSTPVP